MRYDKGFLLGALDDSVIVAIQLFLAVALVLVIVIMFLFFDVVTFSKFENNLPPFSF